MTPQAQAWLSRGALEPVTATEQLFVVEEGQARAVLFLHGFPTWSVDWAPVFDRLSGLGRLIAPDFLGFGFSDKPRRTYSIAAQADLIEQLLARRGLSEVALVAHDYGSIVAQELLRRRQSGRVGPDISSLTLLNGGIIYARYRPTALQTLLVRPLIGPLLSSIIPKSKVRRALGAIWGRRAPLSDEEFQTLWSGMAHDDGHRLAHRLLRYNLERAVHHKAWEAALAAFRQPFALVWGEVDPVSGLHVLESARLAYPQAQVTALADVGHYPQSEAPEAVAAVVRRTAERGWAAT